MRLKDLSKYDIPELVINAWRNRQGDYLLPLQENAIRAGLLSADWRHQPQNLLISAPTSSGKSFCGEIAAMGALLGRKKAVMLLPLKSIAEEKYHYFCSGYKSIGLKTIIVTHDHPENDISFELGNFDLALAIYEKFNRLLTVNLDILQQIGLVIVDELQMLGDPERGPELEMALTKIIGSGYHPRIIALSAVIDDESELAKWLNCRIIKEATRPIDLFQGVVSGGYFHFRSFNSGVEGKEKFPLEENRDGLTDGLINFLKEDNSRKLIFLKSRRDTINAAFKLAASVDWGEAKTTLTRLDDEEPSFLIRSLRQTLSRGIAFHNADLTPSQRQAIEQGYLNGEIRIIFSTTTLAMGVNLPAEMVLLETMKYSAGSFGGRPSLVPISLAEFQNIAGRAGRFGLGTAGSPGKAIVLAGSDFEHEVLWSNYIETNRNGCIKSCLDRYDIRDIILDIVASGLALNIGQLKQVLGGTFHYRDPDFLENASFERELSDLMTVGLITDSLAPTPAGLAIAESGLSLKSYRRYIDCLKKPLPQSLFGWLFLTLGGNDFDISRTGLISSEYRGRYYEKLLHQSFSDYINEITPYIEERFGREPLDFRTSAVLKAAFVLSDWAEQMSVEQLEQRYQLHHGQIINLAENAAWLLASLARIIQANDCNSHLPGQLEDFAFRVQLGISPAMRELHLLACEILNRSDYKSLHENGIQTAEQICQLPREKLADIIKSENRINKLLEIIEISEKEDKMNREMTLGTGVGYHPAMAFGSSVEFHPSVLEHAGSYAGERYLVKIDSFPIRLTGKSFKYLAKLAYSRLVNGEGWLYKDDLEVGFNQARYLYRLKQEVNHDGGCPWAIFENNRLGYYRLDLEPEKIRLNLDNLKTHPDCELRHIADELAPRLVS